MAGEAANGEGAEAEKAPRLERSRWTNCAAGQRTAGFCLISSAFALRITREWPMGLELDRCMECDATVAPLVPSICKCSEDKDGLQKCYCIAQACLPGA